MNINISHDRGILVIALAGELDHHAAGEVFRSFEALPEALPNRCILDLKGVTFMDSSGIAVVLGLHRRLCYIAGELSVINAAPQTMRIFRAAGVDRLVKITQEVIHNASDK